MGTLALILAVLALLRAFGSKLQSDSAIVLAAPLFAIDSGILLIGNLA